MALRVTLGGHDVPPDHIHRRFARSRTHFLNDYLPLADEWVLWESEMPPARTVADSTRHTSEELRAMLDSSRIQEKATLDLPPMVRIGLEASRVATEKMLAHYQRMGIKVTPQMTLAPDQPESRHSERDSH